MAIGRAARRAEQATRIRAEFPGDVDAVSQLLDLLELAWHDCYDEDAPPDSVVDDVFVVADGDLGQLVGAVHLAVRDWRDLRLAALRTRELTASDE